MFARIRTRVLALLVLLSIITYMDRVCISVASKPIREDLGISIEGWGWVMGVFTLAYGVFEIPSGAYGDRFGQRRALTRIVVWWSGFTALTGLTANFNSLMIVRFLFGAGEAGAYPNMTGSVRRWFPASERARSMGYVWGASRVGGALTPWLVVPLLDDLGWRSVFYLFGSFGLIWAIVWWNWFRDAPHQHPSVTAAELEEIGEPDLESGHSAISWSRLAGSGQIWLLVAMYATYVWGAMFFIAWLPNFLSDGRGFSNDDLRMYASLPFVMGALGNFAGGYLSDRASRRLGPKIGRVALGSACLLLSSILMLATSQCQSMGMSAVLLALTFGVLDCMLPCAWAICLDIGGKHAGAVSGVMNTAGQAGGFICNVLFGYMVRWFGNYDAPLVIIAAMVFVSGLLFTQIDPTRLIALDKGLVTVEESECS